MVKSFKIFKHCSCLRSFLHLCVRAGVHAGLRACVCASVCALVRLSVRVCRSACVKCAYDACSFDATLYAIYLLREICREWNKNGMESLLLLLLFYFLSFIYVVDVLQILQCLQVRTNQPVSQDNGTYL